MGNKEQISAEETQRLASVYRSYGEAGFGRSKWNPSNRGNAAIVRERMDVLAEMLNNIGIKLGDSDILEIGCGSGNVIGDLITAGADPARVTGVDLLDDRISEAKRTVPGVNFRVENAAALSFEAESMDLVVFFTVFSSILDEDMRVAIALEADRVLRPGGAIVWCDFRIDNPLNPHVRGINKKMIRSLFPDYRHTMRSITLFPQLARRLGPLTRVLYPVLAAVPMLRTHLVGILVKA